ncbi:hypothetical protein ACLIBG_06760 [Virgibacillus sp. W0181]
MALKVEINKLKQHAYEAELILIINDKEIARFDLETFVVEPDK